MADEITKACCSQNRDQCEKLMNVRFDAIKDVFEAKDRAIALALTKAEEKLEIRLQGLNEYKEASKEFITKHDHEVLVEDVNDLKLDKIGKPEFEFQVREIEQLRLSRAELAGKATQESVNKVAEIASSATWRGNISLLISFVALLLAFAIHFWTK